jgi:hypothetical protein
MMGFELSFPGGGGGGGKKSKQPGIDTKSTEKCKNSYLLHSRWYFDHSPVSLLGLVHQVAHPEQK